MSTCATCDGYFFRNRPIAVVGGGDSAMEEAVYLARLASKVIVIHRRESLRASKIMQEKALKHPKIEFIWNSEVVDVKDVEQGAVNAIVVRNLKTDQISDVPIEGLFIAIGHTPNTSLFTGQLELDATGYIVTHNGTRTSVPGVFAAGDVQDHVYRQAVTAAGTGCMAALDAERYIEQLPEVDEDDGRGGLRADRRDELTSVSDRRTHRRLLHGHPAVSIDPPSTDRPRHPT